MTRWARFRSNGGQTGYGIFEDTRILEYEGDFFAGARPTGRIFAHDEFTLQSPCTPSKIVATPPEQGQHTDEVFKEFGFSDNEIATLHQAKAV